MLAKFKNASQILMKIARLTDNQKPALNNTIRGVFRSWWRSCFEFHNKRWLGPVWGLSNSTKPAGILRFCQFHLFIDEQVAVLAADLSPEQREAIRREMAIDIRAA